MILTTPSYRFRLYGWAVTLLLLVGDRSQVRLWVDAAHVHQLLYSRCSTISRSHLSFIHDHHLFICVLRTGIDNFRSHKPHHVPHVQYKLPLTRIRFRIHGHVTDGDPIMHYHL